MKSRFALSFSVLSLCACAWASSARAEFPAVQNRLLVRLDSGQSKTDLKRWLAEGKLESHKLGALSFDEEISREGGWYSIRYASKLSPAEAAKILNAEKRTMWAQPDYLVHLLDNSNNVATLSENDPDLLAPPILPANPTADPDLSKLWNMDALHMPQVWRDHRGDRKVVVAVIDTGVDYNHEDLVNNLWHNPDTAALDQVGYDFVNNDNRPWDDQGHGTHTSGIVGATGGNGIGISGVSPSVSIMALKFITKEGRGETSDAIKAIDYGISKKVRVMSNSWGGYDDPNDPEAVADNKALQEAINRAEKADVLFVVASGNDGGNNDVKPIYPGSYKNANVLTVASTSKLPGQEEKKSFFSNWGPTTVHVAAPGSNIISTWPGEKKYMLELGTSMAAPHVAGLAALLLSVKPNLSAVELKRIIMDTAMPLDSLQGKVVSGGRIDPAAAMAALESGRF